MELLPVGIAISTPEGIIVDVNPTLLKMTGYDSKDEFLKIPVLAHYVSPADRRQLISQLKQSASAKIELPLKRKDGSSFFAFVTSTIVSDISEKKFIISTIQDITREKEAEKRIQQAQKMEAIGTLAGGIAHDFNNILSAVLGYTELSLLELPKDSKILENLSNVKNGALRARDLVKQILDFSRESKSEKIPANLGPIIKEAIKLIRASLPSTIEIRYFINKDAGIVNINPTQIHQVLMNLCTNAAHAMRVNGGILEIRLTREKIDSSNNIEDPELMEGNYVKLTVSDTGHGIPADIINHIFDPYFTTKERGEGTGLGLSVVHGIVKSHGGAVIAKSEYGKGASFHIFLPCSAVEKEGKELPSKSLTPIPGKGKILFLDDEEVLVHLGQKMLERLGYDVVIRTSSLEALELFKSNPDSFDFVITDLTMPNMTGDRLAKEILEIRPDIPVILCTGFSERISSEIAKAIGIKEFIFKPFTTGDLSTVLNRITRERDETKIPPSPQS
jgi:PAS domain S-box-containing protein